MKILIADADTDSRAILKSFIEKLGHSVVECDHGKDLLGLLFKGDLPQMIFLDFKLPGENYSEICQKIRSHQIKNYTHIVVTAQGSLPNDMVQALKIGANDYLAKPISFYDLGFKIQIGSELVKLRQMVVQQRLQIVNSSKMAVLGEMASSVAHEINNPLTIIDGNIQKLNDNIIKAQNDPTLIMSKTEMSKICIVIMNTVDRIAKIIKTLKAFASDGELEPCQSVKVKDVIDTTVSFCSSKMNIHGVKLIPAEVPNEYIFEVRSVQISQALLNLLDNACLAIQSKNDRWIKIDSAEDTQNIMISVTDSGSGIPEHIRQKIMQPFFTTRSHGKGTGLGLSISKNIIESHGGVLSIDEICPNTRFVMTIPKKRKDNVPAKSNQVFHPIDSDEWHLN